MPRNIKPFATEIEEDEDEIEVVTRSGSKEVAVGSKRRFDSSGTERQAHREYNFADYYWTFNLSRTRSI